MYHAPSSLHVRFCFIKEKQWDQGTFWASGYAENVSGIWALQSKKGSVLESVKRSVQNFWAPGIPPPPPLPFEILENAWKFLGNE